MTEGKTTFVMEEFTPPLRVFLPPIPIGCSGVIWGTWQCTACEAQQNLLSGFGFHPYRTKECVPSFFPCLSAAARNVSAHSATTAMVEAREKATALAVGNPATRGTSPACAEPRGQAAIKIQCLHRRCQARGKVRLCLCVVRRAPPHKCTGGVEKVPPPPRPNPRRTPAQRKERAQACRG